MPWVSLAKQRGSGLRMCISTSTGFDQRRMSGPVLTEA
jgi:hypothetical protein